MARCNRGRAHAASRRLLRGPGGAGLIGTLGYLRASQARRALRRTSCPADLLSQPLGQGNRRGATGGVVREGLRAHVVGVDVVGRRRSARLSSRSSVGFLRGATTQVVHSGSHPGCRRRFLARARLWLGHPEELAAELRNPRASPTPVHARPSRRALRSWAGRSRGGPGRGPPPRPRVVRATASRALCILCPPRNCEPALPLLSMERCLRARSSFH